MIHAVLFELDGTLFDRDATAAAVLESQVRHFSSLIPPARATEFIERAVELDDHGRRDKREVYAIVASEFGERLVASFRSEYPHHCRLGSSIAYTLAELRRRGMAPGIVTNGATVVQNAAIDALGLRDVMDAILISEAEGIRSGDDLVVDVKAASAAGLRAIWKRTLCRKSNVPLPTIDAVSDILHLDELLRSPASRLARFLSVFTAWAMTQTTVQGVALVGSHARGTATEASDVDLVILADDPQAFLRDWSWVESFGKVVGQNTEDYGNVLSLRVYYEEGLEVEFGFADPSWAAMPLDAGTREVIAGGIEVLFERGGAMREIRPAGR